MMTTMSVVAMGGVGILGVAAVATLSFRRLSASLRHSIWMAGLTTTLALPVMEWSAVEIRLPVPESIAAVVGAAGPDERSPETGVVAGLSFPDNESGPSTVEATVAVGHGVTEAGGGAPAADGGGSAGGASASVGDGGSAGQVSAAVGESGAWADRSSPGGSSSEGGLDAAAVALLIWSMGASALLFATLLGQLRALALTTRDVRPAPRPLRRLMGRAMSRLDVRPDVRLVVSDRIGVPATWGLVEPTVVLPADHAHWSVETLERVLLHELAHVARRDCLGYLVGQLARAVHWFNPLAWLAVHRLRVESEHASDDLVLEVVDHPSAYAGDLVTMVRALREGRRVPRAALAVARPSGMSTRVRAILDPTKSRGPVGRGVAWVIGAVAVLLASSATVVTPVVGVAESMGPRVESDAFGSGGGPAGEEEPPSDPRPEGEAAEAIPASSSQEYLCVFDQNRRRSTSTHIDEDEIRIRWETDDCRVEIEIEGEIEFSDDDRRIVSLAPGALFEIEERIDGDRRRARIEGLAGGGMERRYWDDGDETPWGDAADRWLAQILPEVFRHSTINADARVRRMVEEGGPDRVFAEVERIRSDHVARRYLEILMDVAELDEDDYVRVIDAAAAIDSDHGSATLLMAVVDRAGLRPAFQGPLLTASEGLESDHQRTRVLETLLRSPLSPEQLDAVLRSASSIESDHNLGELLSTIARAGRLDDAGRDSFLRALRSIESDHQTATVIGAFLDSGTLDDDELAQVLEMTRDIESDHQLGTVLQRVAREYPLRGPQVTAYLRSAARIESDHQTAETAIAIIDRADFEPEQLDLVLRMTERVESDHQRGKILQTLVRRRDLGPEGLSDLLGVAAGIESDHQLASTLEVVLDEEELDGAALEELLRTVRGVESSHQRLGLLLEIADRYRLDGRARALYADLADDLSRRDRERAVAALSR